MVLSREARLVAGIILITVPTVMYGGLALLGILTDGVAGVTTGGVELDETQWALWRAGHAHAGVWLIVAMLLQILLDSATLSNALRWIARIAAPTAAVLVSAGFFGTAFAPGFRWLLYLGGLSLATAVLLTGVGLLRAPRVAATGAPAHV